MYLRVRAFLLVGMIVVTCSCEKLPDWSASLSSGVNLTTELSQLEQANRVVVTNNGQTVRDSTDPATIHHVVALFQKHPDRWIAVSGVFPDYDIAFFDRTRRIASVGITAGSSIGESQATISVGDYYQRVPANEVTNLANELKLPWPVAKGLPRRTK